MSEKPKNSKDELSSCRCSTTSDGDLQTMKKNSNQALRSFIFMRKDFHQDNGHSSDLDQRRNGTLLVKTIQKENGTKSQSKWCWHLQKADTQYSDPRAHYPEECLRAKVVEKCQCTIAPTRERLKLFFAQLFLFISSVFTEQSQICLKNTGLAKQERETRAGRTIWPIVRTSQFVDDNTNTFDRWSCSRRSIGKVPRTSGKALTTKSSDEIL